MSICDIIKMDNSLLRKVCCKIEKVSKQEKKIIEDMYDTLISTSALGIAAPQIGILKRIIIVKFEDKLYKIINPEIIERKGIQIFLEGCLSVDREDDYMYGEVKRSYYIKVKGLDENGKQITIEEEGIPAVIFQHEIDHLDGIIYTDKLIGELLHFKSKEERKQYKEKNFVHKIIERQGEN